MAVLKVDIVERRLAFRVELFDKVTVEKVENPALIEARFVAIPVLSVDIVERSCADKVELLEEVTVEKVENPD